MREDGLRDAFKALWSWSGSVGSAIYETIQPLLSLLPASIRPPKLSTFTILGKRRDKLTQQELRYTFCAYFLYTLTILGMDVKTARQELRYAFCAYSPYKPL